MPTVPARLASRLIALLLAIGAGYAAALPAAPAAAAADDASADSARQSILAFAREATAILDQTGDPPAAERAFLAVFKARFDVPGQARLALGPYWKDATDEERQTYVGAFENRVITLFAPRVRMLGFAGLTVTATQTAGSLAIVDTQMSAPDRPKLPVRWFLRPGEDGSMRIIDVVADDISMVATLRAELTSLARRSGVGGMIQALQAHHAAAGVAN